MNSKQFLAVLALSGIVFAGYGADFDQAVKDLIPKLAAPNVPDRYDAQMQLQEIASKSSRPGNAAEREALARVLAAKAADDALPQPARVWIVRQLEYMGAGEAVNALTKVMAEEDAELRECARRALEKNPDPDAAASLRAALEKATNVSWKIGLINSLGQRGDGKAVSLIGKQLDDPQTATFAALALGRIASPAAVDALFKALGKKVPGAADALIVAANSILSNKTGARPAFTEAKEIYQKLIAAELPSQTRGAALIGLARTDAAGAEKPLADALTGNDVRLQNAAIIAITDYWYMFDSSSKRSQKLVALLPKLAPPVKARVLGVLDASAESQLIAAAADPEEVVRIAALEQLGRVGGVGPVPALLQAAAGDSKPAKAAADAALAKAPGAGVVPALEKAAAAGEAKSRAAAIGALAARKHTAALPALLRYAGEADATVCKAACAALGQMGADKEVEPLAKLALQSKAPAAAALEAIAERVKDKPAAVRRLLTLAPDDASLVLVLDALSALGGDAALARVAQVATNPNAEARDSAIRALSNWPDYAATKPLLTIAADPNAKPAQQALALQGIVRLVKAAEKEPAQARMDTALAALNAARRDEDKKLVLSALGSVPHSKAAATIMPLLGDPNLKAEAGAAGVALAELLLNTDKETAKELARNIKAANLSRDITRRANAVLNK